MFRYVTQDEAQKEKDRREALKAAGKAPTPAKPQKETPPPFPTQPTRAIRAMLRSRVGTEFSFHHGDTETRRKTTAWQSLFPFEVGGVGNDPPWW